MGPEQPAAQPRPSGAARSTRIPVGGLGTTPAQAAFAGRGDLTKFGPNALLLFAAQLRFQIEDIDTFAASSLTDGQDDKKCDLIMVDKDRRLALVAQAYIAEDEGRREAPANKAADLNAAMAWVLSQPLEEVPAQLHSAVSELRGAISSSQIEELLIWYVHNLPESENVRHELNAVEQGARASLDSHFPGLVRNVSAKEVGRATLDEFYQRLQTNILVTDAVDIEVPPGTEVKGENWTAYTTAIPLGWLYDLFGTYKERLFSANVRDYLGSRKSDSNINNGIKMTAEKEPGNFWVYNNGITAVVNVLELRDEGRSIHLEGISIVNGAQTTGAVGSLKDRPAEQAKVSVRFVKCNDSETLGEIIRSNNNQNRIEASDFRSNDAIQTRLREEFRAIPGVRYLGGRRGGAEDVIRRPSDLLPSNPAAQALMAFHQDPVNAYNHKAEIWESSGLYSRIFNERTTARHVLFCFSLLKSIEAKRQALGEKERAKQLTAQAVEQLAFLRKRGAVHLLVAAVARALESLADRPIPDAFSVSFGAVGREDAGRQWAPIIDCILPLNKPLGDVLQGGLNSLETAASGISAFVAFVEATKGANSSVYGAFSKSLQFG